MNTPFRTLALCPLLGLVLGACAPPPGPSALDDGRQQSPPPAHAVGSALSPVATARFPHPERLAELQRVEVEGGIATDKAERLFKQGRLAEAEAQCREVNRIYESKGDRMEAGIAHLLALIRIRQGRYQDAIRFMAPNLDTNAIMRLDLALCYVRVGDLDRAAAFYDPHLITGFNSAFPLAARYLPDLRSPRDLAAALHWCRGVALSNVARPEEAADDYAVALKAFPHNALLAARLGLEAEAAKRPEQAAAAYAVVQRYGDREMRETTRYAATRTKDLADAARAKRAAKGRESKPNG